MEKEYLRKELYNLRMELTFIKMERKENDERVVDIQNKIQTVRKQIADKDLIEEKEKRNGKKV